jgi:hypothetical protein
VADEDAGDVGEGVVQLHRLVLWMGCLEDNTK